VRQHTLSPHNYTVPANTKANAKTGVNNMSKKKPKKTLSEQKTLPIQSQDARDPKSNAARQSKANVKRAKKWQEEHGA